MLISLIIPAYNEEKTLEKNIKGFSAYLDKEKLDHEIIIINDASTDQTGAIISKLCQENQRIKALVFKKNSGKGAALRAGLLAGQGDYHLFLDADNATSIDHLRLVWPLVKDGCELVIGSRNPDDVPGARQSRPQNICKRKLGSFGNLLIRAATGTKVKDTQCGFKLLSKSAVKKIIPKTKIKRWALDIEIILLAKKLGLRIGIIPVIWNCGPISRVGCKGYLIALKELLLIKYYDLRGEYDNKRESE
jgi:dolichyl-phosphate beta-glucosyltransferase